MAGKLTGPLLAFDALLRGVGAQQERSVRDRDIVLLGECFQPGQADEAPRSDDVAPHLDRDGGGIGVAHGGSITIYGRYNPAMAVFECVECSSPLVFRDNTWQCDNCFSGFAAAPAGIDDVELEAGLTMAEVMRMYEERAARE